VVVGIVLIVVVHPTGNKIIVCCVIFTSKCEIISFSDTFNIELLYTVRVNTRDKFSFKIGIAAYKINFY